MHTNTRGFTLIELLLVIAIITLLTSIIMSQFSIARAKTIDTAKKADLVAMRTAVRAFHLDKGRMPNNYTCTSSCVVNNNRTTLAIEDTDNPENPVTESGKAFKASMQELVAGGYLPRVPQSPGGAGYVYYDYGPGSDAGAIVGTDLTVGTPSTSGEPGTCRPFEVTEGDEPIAMGLVATPLIDWIACQLEEQVGGQCVGGIGDDANFCSTALSSHYCLCNNY